MGILNITPDSFYENSRSFDYNLFNKNVKKIIKSDIIDIGAESTRPSSKPLTYIEELKRLEIVFDNMMIFKNKALSIDTYKPLVAKEALNNGFNIINDIYGGADDDMMHLAAESDVKIILMHIQGNPETMQKNIHYDNIIDDIIYYFNLRVKKAIDLGIKESNIIIDPGIGFGKTLSDNYKIINNINRFKELGFNLMLGTSRKSFLSINNDTAADRLLNTIAVNTIALLKGTDIIRVHDVDEHILLREIVENFKKNI
tara:strand:+ start:742 stop:1512 length:771 start_codon:yes stop_codon:yes gene_type:complete